MCLRKYSTQSAFFAPQVGGSPGHAPVEVRVYNHSNESAPLLEGVICYGIDCIAADIISIRSVATDAEMLSNTAIAAVYAIAVHLASQHHHMSTLWQRLPQNIMTTAMTGGDSMQQESAARPGLMQLQLWIWTSVLTLTSSPSAYTTCLHQRDPDNLCRQHTAIFIECLQATA